MPVVAIPCRTRHLRRALAGCGLLVAGLLLGAPPAAAVTCTASITSPIVFNTLDILSGNAANGEGTLTINCVTTVGDALTLGVVPTCPSINAGTGGAAGGSRLLTGGSPPLTYNLYQDAARTIPWGSATDTTLGTVPRVNVNVTIPVVGTGGGSASVPVYARLNGSQTTAQVGSYTSNFTGTQTSVQYAAINGTLTGSCAGLLGLLTSSTTAPFTVRADVAKNCLVTTQSLSFGSHGVLKSQVDGQGQVNVTCTGTTSYTVGLDPGPYTATTRRMSNGAAFVLYGLYQDTARSVPWGAAAGQMVSGTGTGLTRNITVYGRVPPQTTPAAATYTDNVAVIVTY
ncbi:spore coat protein U domain-containing protein [Xanthobacteraceae bacterium A53D]